MARLLLAAAVIASFVSIADQGGPGSFRGSSGRRDHGGALREPRRRDRNPGWREGCYKSLNPGALAVLIVAIAGAAVTSQAAHGTVWDSPLSDLVWWFDALMLLETIVALLLAIALGIPGCAIGVWRYLIARLRGERPPLSPIGCMVGLHLIDEWEARRRQAMR